jgi:hypothetical protein
MIWCGNCNSFNLKLIERNRMQCSECLYEFNIIWTVAAEREFKLKHNIYEPKNKKISFKAASS